MPNKLYNQPFFRINFIDEIPLKKNKYIRNSKEEEMEISNIKNIKLKNNVCYFTIHNLWINECLKLIHFILIILFNCLIKNLFNE